MARPLITDVKLERKNISVHPDEWEQFRRLMEAKGTTASGRIRRFVKAELKRANGG